MKLTKKEAIRRHRLLWNWIADETIRRNECVEKREAFEHFGWPRVSHNCWLCEYDCSHKKNYCGENCIIVFWIGENAKVAPLIYTTLCIRSGHLNMTRKNPLRLPARSLTFLRERVSKR